MTVTEVLSDLFNHGNRVDFNDGILQLRQTDVFRVLLGNDEHIYKIYWINDFSEMDGIPQEVLHRHVNQTKLSFARGTALFDCLVYPSKEYIEEFNRKLGIYDRG
jgi:hypothetical protein